MGAVGAGLQPRPDCDWPLSINPYRLYSFLNSGERNATGTWTEREGGGAVALYGQIGQYVSSIGWSQLFATTSHHGAAKPREPVQPALLPLLPDHIAGGFAGRSLRRPGRRTSRREQAITRNRDTR